MFGLKLYLLKIDHLRKEWEQVKTPLYRLLDLLMFLYSKVIFHSGGLCQSWQRGGSPWLLLLGCPWKSRCVDRCRGQMGRRGWNHGNLLHRVSHITKGQVGQTVKTWKGLTSGRRSSWVNAGGVWIGQIVGLTPAALSIIPMMVQLV